MKDLHVVFLRHGWIYRGIGRSPNGKTARIYSHEEKGYIYQDSYGNVYHYYPVNMHKSLRLPKKGE
jgi:hypothetical protein